MDLKDLILKRQRLSAAWITAWSKRDTVQMEVILAELKLINQLIEGHQKGDDN